MVFTEDELHCDIFALVWIIQRIFVGSCELTDISQALFFHPLLSLFWDHLCLLCLEISESDSLYVSSMAF